MSEEQLKLDIPYDPFTASPSAVETAELCLRKWGWSALDGIKGPPNKYAEFGTKTHNHLERWLMTGHPPPSSVPEGKLAQQMLLHLPPPQQVDPSFIEVELSMRLGGVYFLGRIDLFMPRLIVPTVFDHKTTSDLKWALTPEEMSDDVQATLYAAYAMLKTRAKTVRVQWTYGERKTKRALPVVRDLCGSDIRDRITKTIETAREMRRLSESTKTALDLPYNAMACEAYGGCPYISQCNLSEAERIEAIMGQSFEQRLRERSAAASKVNSKNEGTSEEKPKTEKKGTEDKAGENALMKRMRERLEAQKASEQAPDPDDTTAPEGKEEEAPKKRGRGRPRKQPAEGAQTVDKLDEVEEVEAPRSASEAEVTSYVRALMAPKEMTVHHTREALSPKEMWVDFVCAALRSGASVKVATGAASAALIECGELFPSEE